VAKQILDKALRLGEKKKLKNIQKQVKAINSLEDELSQFSDQDITAEALDLRERAKTESLEEILPETFALVREAAKRTLGQRHYDEQLIGGIVLNQGGIAEMKTGEGKTLTSTLAISLNALSGKPVHVVTVNDYLAKRDATWMKPIYDLLGLSVSYLLDSDETPIRREKYQADITYGTNSEFGFDYLRDNMASSKEEQVQGELAFAIVDEVDNILIDEARTPLIISGSATEASKMYYDFAKLAKQMKGVPQKVKLKSAGETRDTVDADYDFEFDEKHKTVAVTERGVALAEKFLGIDHLYTAENGEMVNHLMQALKAQSLYQKDVDYAVVDADVKIIDEFTGRILDGRRWSEGLHQAIEAKEGLMIQEENQTMATITLQNYFRLYDKLSGMTGTALTEATEFMKIYNIEVVEIPTHVPVQREDLNDQIYKTKEDKWQAVLNEVIDANKKGQPVLIGTASVEASEELSAKLKKNGINNSVLNAKPEYAKMEAETIAQAGAKGKVTIATNMAGRGVDIKLGGDPEMAARLSLGKQGVKDDDLDFENKLKEKAAELAPEFDAAKEEVKDLGGLYIIGTERHESRRIDNQLRGRAGRQGDPGKSRFYLSAEDELIRLFAGDKIYNILDKTNEDVIESKLLTKTVENAQKKVEEQNFLLRKRILEYDDVLSSQREVIYKYRQEILDGRDMSDVVKEETAESIQRTVDEYLPEEYSEEWDLEGLEIRLQETFPLSIDISSLDHNLIQKEILKEEIVDDFKAAYQKREEEIGAEAMREVERIILLSVIDSRWPEHLFDLDYLREGIHLRGFAQIDPLVAYKNEGYLMFESLIENIWDEFAQVVLRVEVTFTDPNNQPENDIQKPVKQVTNPQKIGRNDPCYCGSGKKYKKCHGAN